MPLPPEVAAIVAELKCSLLSTLTNSGVPITDALAHIWVPETGGIDYGTGVSYPAKAERARSNPHVGLLFHDQTPTGPVVVIAADATVLDSDLQANTDRWVRFRWEASSRCSNGWRRTRASSLRPPARSLPNGGRTQ